MLRGIIRGNIVSTRKQQALVGSKFMEVEIMKNGELTRWTALVQVSAKRYLSRRVAPRVLLCIMRMRRVMR